MRTLEKALKIKKIWQKDNFHFCIEWLDGITTVYRLSHLQRVCPCSYCYNESEGKRRESAPLVNENVRCKTIQSVGRYAIRINFTEGCSTGIYDFEFLRSIGEVW